MRRSVMAWMGALVLVGAGAFAAVNQRTTTDDLAVARASATSAGARSSGSSSTTADTAQRPRRTWSLGKSYLYSVAHVTSMQSESGEPVARAKTSAKLRLTVVGAGEDRVLVRVELSELAQESSTGGAAGATSPHLAYLELGRDGLLRSAHFTRGTSRANRVLIRQLSGIVHVVDDDARAAWTKLEDEATGEIETAYAWDGAVLTREKLRIVRLRTGHGLVPVSASLRYDVRGSARIALGASGWPDSVEGHQRDEMAVGPTRIVANGTFHGKLEATTERTDLIGTFDRDRARLDADIGESAEDAAVARRLADQALLGRDDFASLAHALASHETGPDRARAVSQVAALVRLDSNAASEVLASVRRSPTAPATRGLLGALGAAGTIDGARALGAVLASDLPAETKVQAAHALAMSPTGTEEGRRALRAPAASEDPELREAARLALGAQIGKSADRDASDLRDAVDELIQKLAAATEPSEKIALLGALGNTRSERARDVILSARADGNPEVRAAAVVALRFLQGDGVIQALIAALGDEAASVRVATLGAITFQPAAAFTAPVAGVLRHDEDVNVRLSAVRTLSRALGIDAEAERALVSAASSDPDERVRAAATAALSRAPS